MVRNGQEFVEDSHLLGHSYCRLAVVELLDCWLWYVDLWQMVDGQTPRTDLHGGSGGSVCMCVMHLSTSFQQYCYRG